MISVARSVEREDPARASSRKRGGRGGKVWEGEGEGGKKKERERRRERERERERED